MITSALILVPDSADALAGARVAGLPLLTRALLTAQRAGARICYVTAGRRDEAWRQTVHGNAQLETDVVWLTPSGPGSADSAPPVGLGLVFSVDTLFDPKIARSLDGGPHGGQAWAVDGPDRSPAVLFVPATRLPLALASAPHTPNLAAVIERVGGGVTRLPTERLVHRLGGLSGVKAAEEALLRSVEPPATDGVFDVYVNRRLSRSLTRAVLRTPLTPNQITIVSSLIGVLGACCLALGSYLWTVLGAGLFQLSAIVDCVDGDVARLKFRESRVGKRLDELGDLLVHGSVFLAIGAAVWRQGHGTAALLLGVLLGLGALITFPLTVVAERTETQGRRRGGWENRVLSLLVYQVANRDCSMIVLGFAVVNRLVWFLWGAAVGAQLFWLTLAALLVRTGRLRGPALPARTPGPWCP